MKYSIENETTQFSSKKPFNILSRINQVSKNLHFFSLQLMKNEFDAKDLYQDTVLKIISKSDKFKPGTNFKAWAMTVMRNIFINNYRRKKRMMAILDTTQSESVLKLDAGNSNESDIAYKELLKKVSKLPENYKKPFWMVFIGYQYKEISEMLNIPVGTVKSRVYYARRSLQFMCKDF